MITNSAMISFITTPEANPNQVREKFQSTTRDTGNTSGAGAAGGGRQGDTSTNDRR